MAKPAPYALDEDSFSGGDKEATSCTFLFAPFTIILLRMPFIAVNCERGIMRQFFSSMRIRERPTRIVDGSFYSIWSAGFPDKTFLPGPSARSGRKCC